MATPLKDRIIQSLDGMSDRQLEHLARVMAEASPVQAEPVSGAEFLRRARGWIPNDDADEMIRIIEQECEQIDWDAWDLPAGHERSNSHA